MTKEFHWTQLISRFIVFGCSPVPMMYTKLVNNLYSRVHNRTSGKIQTATSRITGFEDVIEQCL